MKKAREAVTIAWMTFLLLGAAFPATAQEEGGPPPALVTVSGVREGTVDPVTEFVGTAYYPEVSEVSAEVSGSVVEVRFDEGHRVRKGEALVLLDRDLLEKTLESTRATREQNLADLEKAKRDLARIEKLYREESIAEQVYDENRFRVKSLEKRAESLAADVERLEIERARKTVRAPFDGIVIKKHVERGEWISPGTAVATLGRDDTMDVVVEVPGDLLPFVKKGTTVRIRIAGQETQGTVSAIVPRGDIATRTFPVKIRVPNRFALIEGMEARVDVPSGKKEQTLLVPRDALVTAMGQTVVYTVVDAKAKMVPVTVTRYVGKEAAVRAGGLGTGTEVMVKGHERIRDGQPVLVKPSGEQSSGPSTGEKK